MRDTLIIHLPASSSQGEPGLCQWMRIPGNPAASRDSGQAELPSLLGTLVAERIIVFVPSEAVSLKQVDIPVRQTSKLLMAVPYALEDQLAADVSQLHFALGPRQAGGVTPVAVVSHSQMQDWLQAFEQAHIQPDLMIPDVLGLPFSADQPTLYIDDQGRALVRNGVMSGFASPRALLPQMLPQGADQGLFLLQSADAQLPEGYSISRSQSAASLFDALTEYADSSQRINLLQGRYAPKHAAQQWLQAARWPAALAASWIVLASVLLALENRQKHAQYDQFQDRAVQEFNAAFPDTTRIVDMRAQAAQQLAQLKGGGSSGGFMKLLSDSSPVLDRVKALKVEGLQFRDGSLYISLSGSDLQALELLRAEFDKVNSLKLDVQSAQAGTDGVQIRLKVDQA